MEQNSSDDEEKDYGFRFHAEILASRSAAGANQKPIPSPSEKLPPSM
jgi:hypothetical protein